MYSGIWITNIHKDEFKKNKQKFAWYFDVLKKTLIGPPRSTKNFSTEELTEKGYVGLYSTEELSFKEFELLGGNLSLGTNKKKKVRKLITVEEFDDEEDFFVNEFKNDPNILELDEDL